LLCATFKQNHSAAVWIKRTRTHRMKTRTNTYRTTPTLCSTAKIIWYGFVYRLIVTWMEKKNCCPKIFGARSRIFFLKYIFVFQQQMSSDNRNMAQDGVASRTSFYNSGSPQLQRESETGISVDRQYDAGYNGMHEGERPAGGFTPDGLQLLSTSRDW